MKKCFVFMLAFQSALCTSQTINRNNKANWKNITKFNCKRVKCPPIEDPICVRMRNKKLGSKTKDIHIIMLNKCEMEYMKCHQDYQATVVSMKNCGRYGKPLDQSGKLRLKREVLQAGTKNKKTRPYVPGDILAEVSLFAPPSMLIEQHKVNNKEQSEKKESQPELNQEKDEGKIKRDQNVEEDSTKESNEIESVQNVTSKENEQDNSTPEPDHEPSQEEENDEAEKVETNITPKENEQDNSTPEPDHEASPEDEDYEAEKVETDITPKENDQEKPKPEPNQAESLEEDHEEEENEETDKAEDKDNTKSSDESVSVQSVSPTENEQGNFTDNTEDPHLTPELPVNMIPLDDPEESDKSESDEGDVKGDDPKGNAEERDTENPPFMTDVNRPSNEEEQNDNDNQKEKEEGNDISQNDDKPNRTELIMNDYDLNAANEEVDFEEYVKDCPTICPAAEVMLCGRCKDGIYRTFMSVCHLRMFNCKHPDEKAELVSRYPCILSAPYLNETPPPKGRVSEPNDTDLVLQFIRCRERGQLEKGVQRCNFESATTKKF